MTDLSLLDQDTYVTTVHTLCGRCGGPAPKHGAWLLDTPLEAVCAACMLWADDSHVEALVQDPRMKPHQPAASRFLARRRYALLADDLGLGKGIEALKAIPPGSPVAVLAPKSMAAEWYDEAARWRPDLHPYRASRASLTWPGPGMLISVNYEAAPPGLPHPGTVFILDEPHQKVKNPGAELTRKVRGLVRYAVVHGGRCWLLTGTPLINSPKDMLDLLDVVLIGHAAFGSRSAYRALLGAAYSNKRGQKIAGEIADRAGVRRQLSKVTIRRLKKDLPDLRALRGPLARRMQVRQGCSSSLMATERRA